MGQKTKSIIIILFTLLTGVGIGMWLSGQLLENRLEGFRRYNSPDRFKEFMHTELELTEEQQIQVDSVMQDHFPQMMRARKRMMRMMREEMDNLNSDILPILNEEQQRKLQEHFKRMKKFRREKHPGGPGGHEGPGGEHPHRDRPPDGHRPPGGNFDHPPPPDHN